MFFTTINDKSKQRKLEKLYDHYKDLAFSIAKNILKDNELAEDAVYETFTRLNANLDKVNGIDSKPTKYYIVTIVKNASLDITKSGKREILTDYNKEEFQDKALYSRDPMNIVINKNCYERAKVLIKELDPIYKDVFLLRTSYNMTYEEISDVLKININSAKKRYTRAKNQLAQQLEKEGYVNE